MQKLNNPFDNINTQNCQQQLFPQQPIRLFPPLEQPQQQQSKKKGKKKYLLLLLLLLLILSCWLAKDFFIGGDSPISRIINRDPNQSAGVSSKSDEEYKVANDGKVAEGMMRIRINTVPVFETGTSEGPLNIVNRDVNRYPQLIEIYTKDDNTLLYSGAVDVGYQVENAKLLVDLPKGVYKCIAYFMPFDPETNQILGLSGKPITITVLN